MLDSFEHERFKPVRAMHLLYALSTHRAGPPFCVRELHNCVQGLHCQARGAARQRHQGWHCKLGRTHATKRQVWQNFQAKGLLEGTWRWRLQDSLCSCWADGRHASGVRLVTLNCVVCFLFLSFSLSLFCCRCRTCVAVSIYRLHGFRCLPVRMLLCLQQRVHLYSQMCS